MSVDPALARSPREGEQASTPSGARELWKPSELGTHRVPEGDDDD